MKKTAVICKKYIAAVVAALLLLCFSSCDGDKNEYEQYGIEFMSLEGMNGYKFLDRYTGSMDAYACKIKNVTVSRLEIPSTYNGKPVVAVVNCLGANEILTDLRIDEGVQFLESCFKYYKALESLTIPKSVTHIFGSFGHCSKLEELSFSGDIDIIDETSFNGCDALKSVTFMGNVGEISGLAFEKCPKLEKVDFNGEVGKIEGCAFMDCSTLKTVVLSENTIVGGDAFKNESDGVLFGSKSLLDYHAEYSTDSLLEHAYSVLGKKLDDAERIEDSEAEGYADVLNGPIISFDKCPDCVYSDYSEKYVPENTVLKLDDIHTLNVEYPNTVYSNAKAQNVLDGNAPFVYCLCETAGYKKGPDYVYGGESGYYKYYRISLWDGKSGELIAWFLHKNGYAPGMYTLGEHITYEEDDSVSGRRFFLEQDKSRSEPVKCVMEYIFGIGK